MRETYAGPRSLVRHTLCAGSGAELAEWLALQDFLSAYPEVLRVTRRGAAG